METADDGISFGSYLTQQTPAMPTPSCRLWLQFPFEAMIWETLEIISDPADSRPLRAVGSTMWLNFSVTYSRTQWDQRSQSTGKVLTE